ncbi:zinc-dependent metalloprotease [Salinarchaeum laminariae]|uniref:zinc-dependent metalloprotease n=1 Tax=Salinarchaeum laminariae TaxID=869888 RepID=UPI0020C162EA|nr:zinc-dependent metalloprotease [Salinarchaeum laminariae]
MTIYHSVRAVAGASGSGLVDWNAVTEAACASTDPGSLELTAAQREGYAADVRDARERVREVTAHEFVVPETLEIQHRHHWIDANVATFRRVMEPLEGLADDSMVPGLARKTNTGTMSVMLGYLARNVLGQYDPLLLADAPQDDHGLYFVHPNIVAVADSLDVDFPRFRRWIAFHEVTHAAEFGAAPWLTDHLAERMEEGIDGVADGTLDRETFTELQTAMTAVEGYAELLMDEAFDDESDDLREKLDARRQEAGPLGRLLRRALGIGLKREQYERGKAFFDDVAQARGLGAAGAVWESPDHLPTEAELDDPALWLQRIDP